MASVGAAGGGVCERVFDGRVESPSDGVKRRRARTIAAVAMPTGSGRPRPRRLDRLPEQYFGALLGRVAAARGRRRPAGHRSRARQSGGRAARPRRRGARGGRRAARQPRLCAVPRACPSSASRSPAATATTTAPRSTRTPRSRSCRGRRLRSSSSPWPSPRAATGSCFPTRTTPTTRRGSRLPERSWGSFRSTRPPAGSPTSRALRPPRLST